MNQIIITCTCATHDRWQPVQMIGVYDGIGYWECTRCGQHWHRWSEGRVHDVVEVVWKQQKMGDADW